MSREGGIGLPRGGAQTVGRGEKNLIGETRIY